MRGLVGRRDVPDVLVSLIARLPPPVEMEHFAPAGQYDPLTLEAVRLVVCRVREAGGRPVQITVADRGAFSRAVLGPPSEWETLARKLGDGFGLYTDAGGLELVELLGLAVVEDDRLAPGSFIVGPRRSAVGVAELEAVRRYLSQAEAFTELVLELAEDTMGARRWMQVLEGVTDRLRAARDRRGG